MKPFKPGGGALPGSRDFRWKIGPLAAGLVTMGFGLLALLGWVAGWRWLASFDANLIPMAPSTAVLFLVFGAALGVRARTPLSLRALRGCAALAGSGTLVTLLLITLDWLHLPWVEERLGLNSAEMVGGAPIGHMSLVSAGCFLLAGGSLLASLSRSAIRPWRIVLALVMAGVLLTTSFIFVLAYGLGAPLLYDSTVIPPALTTLLAFGTLGLALLTLAAQPAELLRRLPGEKFQPTVIFVLVFLLLSLSIVAAGYIYFRNSERHFRADAEEQLSVIADLKVAQIASWRRERVADANLVHSTPYVARRALDALADPASSTTRQMFTSWLASLFAGGSYEQAVLLDDQLRVGLTYPESPAGGLSEGDLRAAQEALRSRQVVVADLHRETEGGPVFLSLMVPLVVRQESTGEKVQAAGRGSSPADRSAGVLILRINAQTELYPLIQFWPTPSRTGETLLVRREGNEAVVLNELRFQKNPALTLRVPLTNTALPAVKAALGQEGFVEGRDYRGGLVLAAVRGVPESPWFLVARQDLAEVNEPLRAQLWQGNENPAAEAHAKARSNPAFFAVFAASRETCLDLGAEAGPRRGTPQRAEQTQRSEVRILCVLSRLCGVNGLGRPPLPSRQIFPAIRSVQGLPGGNPWATLHPWAPRNFA